MQQRLRVLAARDQRARQLQPLGGLEHQQHALGAGELGGLVDQEFMQFGGTAQFVQAQACIDQPFERLPQIRFPRQMGGAPFRGEPPLARVLDPREDDLAVRLDLVQVVAAPRRSLTACAGRRRPSSLRLAMPFNMN